MAEKSVNHLMAGDVLYEDVVTSLGGTLFVKDTVLNDDDIEVLKAFLIQNVAVSKKKNIVSKVEGNQKKEKLTVTPSIEGTNKTKEINTPVQTETSETTVQNSVSKQQNMNLMKEYEQTLNKVKMQFQQIIGGVLPDIFTIRSFLIPYIEKILHEPTFVLNLPKVSSKEFYFQHHALNVASLVALLAYRANFPSKDVRQIAMAGLLHNVGNFKIDMDILNKSTSISEEEFKQIKQHTVYGYQMLKDLSGINEGVKLAALQHHEREDGSGYPLQLKSPKIHSYAKLVSIADIYCAMCSERIYKNALSPYLVLEQILNDSFGKLYPNYVHILEQLVSKTIKIGARVILSNNKNAEIVYVNHQSPIRPIVSTNEGIINLEQNRNIYIAEVIE